MVTGFGLTPHRPTLLRHIVLIFTNKSGNLTLNVVGHCDGCGHWFAVVGVTIVFYCPCPTNTHECKTIAFILKIKTIEIVFSTHYHLDQTFNWY